MLYVYHNNVNFIIETILPKYQVHMEVSHIPFPQMVYASLRQLQPLIRDCCNRHNLPYKEKDSMWQATVDFYYHIFSLS
jgi:hypothetical protein